MQILQVTIQQNIEKYSVVAQLPPYANYMQFIHFPIFPVKDFN